MAVALSVMAADRVRASGIAIALWFFYVLVYDLLLLALLVVTEGQFNVAFFPVLLLLSPADVFRILNLLGLDDLRQLWSTVFPQALGNAWLLAGVMLAWIVAPLGLAIWRFR